MENNQDIKISTKDYRFHFRVIAVIEQNGKLLIQKINDKEYFVLPGGHVMQGETSLEALQREIKEEIGCDIDPKSCKFFCFHENLYNKNERLEHWLESYFIAKPQKPLPANDWNIEENDKGELKLLQFKWVTKDELKKLDLKPTSIKNLIVEGKTDKFTHIIDKNKI